MAKMLRQSALPIIVIAAAAHAQEAIQVPVATVGGGDGDRKIEVVVRQPPAGSSGQTKYPAVIVLHSSWGWADFHEGAADYAKALAKAGYVTLEPRMFASTNAKLGGPDSYLPAFFGVLKYAATRADVDANRIAATGFSFGGMVSLAAATKWANQLYLKESSPRVAAYAPFYPVCWLLKANATGRPSPVPTAAWSEWTGAPVKIFSGGKDNYDDRDPKACQEAVDSLPEPARKSFSVTVYPDATHGWDQRGSASFFENIACKGRGCFNINVPDAQVAQQSLKDLIEFLGTAMPAPSRK
jgi:dienelactone hydrolase